MQGASSTRHPDDQVLVIGAYLDQLEAIGEYAGRRADHPGVDDEQAERERLYESFPNR